MNNTDAAISLFKKGLAYKLKGDLENAKDSFSSSISNDPSNKDVFYELGKLEFLRGKYSESINSYLAYTHLQLNIRLKQNNNLLDFPDKDISEDFYKNLPSEIKNIFPDKSASYIYEDGDICNHISHSYFGSHNIEDPILLRNFKFYYSTLVGNHLVQMTMDQYNMSYDEYEDINLSTFIPQGRLILLDNIIWEKLGNDDVLNIYFK